MSIESVLADAFAEHRHSVGDARHLLPEILERTTAPPPWWRRPPVLLAAAAAAVVLLAVGLTQLDDRTGTDSIDVAAPTLAPGAFDDAVDPICADLIAAVDQTVVFDTPEAYVLVAEARRDAIAAALADIARLVDPTDAPGLVDEVLADLRLAALDAAAAVDEATAGELALADGHFASYDGFVRRAGEPLASHGAEVCSALVP